MWTFVVVSLMFTVMVLTSGSADSIARENPADKLALKAEAARFERFRMAADMYVKSNPTVSGSLFWPTMRTVPGLPSAIANANMPADWKAVADGAGGYTLCVTVRDGAEVFLRNSVPLVKDAAMYKSAGGAVVFTHAPGQINTEASKC